MKRTKTILTERCILSNAASAELKQKFRSNRMEKDLYIAGIAIAPTRNPEEILTDRKNFSKIPETKERPCGRFLV